MKILGLQSSGYSSLLMPSHFFFTGRGEGGLGVLLDPNLNPNANICGGQAACVLSTQAVTFCGLNLHN